eukprot:CAMPEP_0176013708 /NCGR_PEP_ID=MMETSP0120_2-20121206/6447_1 /TAXON_ID=160619 /ORGANISM="Kryptoperidinium foliaceum, Strain CCMP 1326" /LENGTH=583 /DNA_ID=CAMNT_0017346627 /DNA_START=88 /DNA_END=1836 /DNA_ORIENTATION=+
MARLIPLPQKLALLIALAFHSAPGLKREPLLESRAEAVPLHGDLRVDGRYFVTVLVGTPPQRVVAVVDTVAEGGIAFPCLPCGGCRPGEDHGFRPEASGSAAFRHCDASCVGDCQAERCTSRLRYGTDRGDVPVQFLQDTVRLGDAPSEGEGAQLSNLHCLQSSYDPAVAWRGNGVLSLGPPRRILEEMYGTPTGQEGSAFFSLCLADQGGQLTINGYNDSFVAGPMQWMPMRSTEGTGYQVDLVGYRIAARSMKRFPKAKPATLDVGSAHTYLPPDVYKALASEIERFCSPGKNGSKSPCGAGRRGSTCWAIWDVAQGPAKFPSIAFGFSGLDGSVAWEASSYLARVGRTSTWCYSFQDIGDDSSVALGASWMLNREVVFDSFQGSLGVASATCPRHPARPDASGIDAGLEVAAAPPGNAASGTAVVSPPTATGEGGVPTELGRAASQEHLRGSPDSSGAAVDSAAIEPMTDAEVEARQSGDKLAASQGRVAGGPGVRGGRSGGIPFIFSGVSIGLVIAFCAGSRGALHHGGPHRQLRETLMDEVLASGAGGASRNPGSNVPATASPVELTSRAQDVAEDEQ